MRLIHVLVESGRPQLAPFKFSLLLEDPFHVIVLPHIKVAYS